MGSLIDSTLTKTRACILRTELHNVKIGIVHLTVIFDSACLKSIGDPVKKLEIEKIIYIYIYIYIYI